MSAVKLNIGGKSFATQKQTLIKSSFFKNMFESECKNSLKTEQGEWIVDRNGTLFEHILDFLRIGNLSWIDGRDLVMMKGLMAEADFYGIPTLTEYLNTKEEQVKEKQFEVMRLESFNLIAGLDLQYQPEEAFSPLYHQNYLVLSVFKAQVKTYICPRGIYVHTLRYGCGRKCNRERDPYSSTFIYKDVVSVLFVYLQ
ncbi:BTB/POZ protein [Sporodiniella umbellata]|nr:BTB/POZ protein [Sporodiniella umbellata]